MEHKICTQIESRLNELDEFIFLNGCACRSTLVAKTREIFADVAEMNEADKFDYLAECNRQLFAHEFAFRNAFEIREYLFDNFIADDKEVE